MESLLPDVAEEDADSAEVESGDDYIEGDEAGLVVSAGQMRLQVFFEFAGLHGQFEEMVVPLDVGRVVHEEHQQVGVDVDQFLSGKRELNFL